MKQKLFIREGEKAIRFALGCVILGIEYLHERGIVHGDLKPENLFVFKDGYVKLGDFGVSARIKDDERIHLDSATPTYCAPEIIYNKKCGK